jgi:hypothetical protein
MKILIQSNRVPMFIGEMLIQGYDLVEALFETNIPVRIFGRIRGLSKSVRDPKSLQNEQEK